MANLTVMCAILLANSCLASGFLSWLTGGNSSSTNRPVPDGVLGTDSYVGGGGGQYPEESGECSHWGDVTPSPYPMRDPMSQHFEFNKGLASPGELIGSHRRLPVGSLVTITNMKNGNTVTVRVVPPRSIPIAGRIMDLSPTAFSQLANLREGVFICNVRVVQAPGSGGGGGGMGMMGMGIQQQQQSLPSYSMMDSHVLRVKPTSYEPEPRDAVQVGTGATLVGLGVAGKTTQNGFVDTVASGIRVGPPYPPVHVGGSGYYPNVERERLHHGASIVTARDPEGQTYK